MSLIDARLCGFCGKKPDNKNREHVIPTWLLEMTGRASRTAPLAWSFDVKDHVKFAWSQFVIPACEKCNSKYSLLEAEVKPVISSLLQHIPVSAKGYITLFDWLDKVRLGIWFAHQLIEKHPIQFAPNHFIDARVGQKDRMIALYSFNTDAKGISLYGPDSLIFKDMPSCFGIRVNNILIINASTDWLCAKGCGYPYPEIVERIGHGEHRGKLATPELKMGPITHPIMPFSLVEPPLWLYQPLRQLIDRHVRISDPDGKDCQPDNVMRLFRQYPSHVEIIEDLTMPIHLSSVHYGPSVSAKDILASIYDLQIDVFRKFPQVDDAAINEYRSLVEKHTQDIATARRTQPWPKPI